MFLKAWKFPLVRWSEEDHLVDFRLGALDNHIPGEPTGIPSIQPSDACLSRRSLRMAEAGT